MEEKDKEWKTKEGALQEQLENVMRTNVDLSNYENMTRTQLEQVKCLLRDNSMPEEYFHHLSEH